MKRIDIDLERVAGLFYSSNIQYSPHVALLLDLGKGISKGEPLTQY